MKKTLAVIIALTLLGKAKAQQVLMQGWYWDYPKTAGGFSWADTLRLKAASLKQAGITHLWFPPHVPASFGTNSNGYDPKDLFIGNTTTGLGTRPALNAMLSEFTAQGIAPVADMIYNHRDGGAAENNPAVQAYITNHYTAAKEPFPSDRFRCVLPLGGSSLNGAGDYYIKISSKTGDNRFNNYGYKLYVVTNRISFQNLAAQNEAEPNGGGDCGQAFNNTQLGRDMMATVETTTGCNTDEFKLTINPSDYFAAGDSLFIYLTNTGGYSDHRIYGMYSTGRSADVANELLYQTYTAYNNMPSGRGQMNYNFFKPNDANASTTFLNGDWDGMYFFYDYDQFQPQTRDTLIAWTKWNWQELGVRGLRMDAVKHFTPAFVGQMLNSLHADSYNPSMVVGEWYSTTATELNGWVNDVKAAMNASALAAIQPKIFDFTLRENLRQACDNSGFDVRNVFNGSLRDAAGTSGFNVVTFVNNHDFRDANGFASLIKANPDLGYAYILTNNQLGVPTIFYPDYYGYPAPSGGLYSYHPTGLPAYSTDLNKLMEVLRLYVNGSPSVDYLNRFSTPYSSNFIAGSSNKALIYQLQGHAGNGNRSVVVAINFGSTPLRVDHGINTYGGTIPVGTQFTDVLGRSAFPYAQLSNSNQIYMELPARSYSVWVQGTLQVLPLQLMGFDAKAVGKHVQLQWTVGSNEDIRSFAIERAEDGVNYTTIGGKLSTGRAGTASYEFVDAEPKKNTGLLYRLKLTGKDGSVTYSDLRMARINDEAIVFKLKQNPVRSTVDVEVACTERTKLTATVFNNTGQKVATKSVALQGGANNISLPATALTAGVYRLVLEAAGQRKVFSFVKE